MANKTIVVDNSGQASGIGGSDAATAAVINATTGFQKNGTALAAADLTQNGTGTTSATFQLDSGGSGPKLKNSSGDVSVKNAADSAQANVDAAAYKVAGTTMLDANGAAAVAASVAGNGLTHSGGVIAVNVDGSTLEISADVVRMKDAGTTPAKLDSTLKTLVEQQAVSHDVEGTTAADTIRVTIQVKDAAGTALTGRYLIEWWIADTAYSTTLTAQSPTVAYNSGAALTTVTANKHARAITDANAKLVLDITLSGNLTIEVQSCLIGPVANSQCDFN